MRTRTKILGVIVLLILAGIYYYITLPAINIHEPGLWIFAIVVFVIITCVYMMARQIKTKYEIKDSKVVKILIGIIGLIIIVFIVGNVLSSPIINATKYKNLITIQTRNFTDDIKETDFSQIPLLDKDSATLLGNRKMGSIVEYVSQFEVSDIYSQINYKGKPYRVTPLVYASPVKWFTNQSDGIPAYITIDMATQETNLVKLDKPIKYSQSEYFNRKIERHLRFNYPTYMFDEMSFEIDDNGVPYWICPVKKYNIGLFGGQTIGRVVLCNASTGECTDYAIEDCPQWVDKAYPSQLLIDLYDYHGKLINGFINSVFGQKGCLKTTDGYNYVAMEDDVWVYTGITSVSGDLSNVGFVLMNQRTMEIRYYEVNGAEEYSAMDSAKGQVQNLGYSATFPLLLNIAGEPTYFMGLKDAAGLVKKYAMVNIQKYQNVAIGDTVAECEKNYVTLLSQNGVKTDSEESKVTETVTGKIKRIAQSVVDGNSHFYITIENNDLIFDVPFSDYVGIIKYNEGDDITIEYISGDPICTVLAIK